MEGKYNNINVDNMLTSINSLVQFVLKALSLDYLSFLFFSFLFAICYFLGSITFLISCSLSLFRLVIPLGVSLLVSIRCWVSLSNLGVAVCRVNAVASGIIKAVLSSLVSSPIPATPLGVGWRVVSVFIVFIRVVFVVPSSIWLLASPVRVSASRLSASGWLSGVVTHFSSSVIFNSILKTGHSFISNSVLLSTF